MVGFTKENRQSRGRLILRVLAFWLITALVLEGLSWVMRPGKNSSGGGMLNYRARGFYGEEKNSLDVIAIGNSDLYSAFSPMELWESHGISGYACGEIKQQMDQAVLLLQEVLTCQKPEIVILEVDELFEESMHRRLDAALKAAIKLAFPVLQYHDRWKELKLKDFLGNGEEVWRDPCKGYYYSGECVPYKGADYMTDEGESVQMDETAVYFLNEFLNICRQADIQVILMEMPSANSWNMGRHRAVASFAKQQGLPFVDFNLNMAETGFDWKTDSRDGGNHLNHSGARKISAWIGDYLVKNYTLLDHRQEERYQQWQEDLKWYRRNMFTE